jgi:hypothetical protein
MYPERNILLVSNLFIGEAILAEPKTNNYVRTNLSSIIIALVILLTIFSFILIYTTEIFWIAHAIAGTVSLIFAILVAVSGATVTGRVRRVRGLNFRLHKRLGISLVLLIGVTFFYGPYARWLHDEFLFWQHTEPWEPVFKGWLGLGILIVAVSQVILSLAVKNRRRIRKLHMIIGYSLVILIVIETVVGIALGISETAELILPIL